MFWGKMDLNLNNALNLFLFKIIPDLIENDSIE